MKFINILLDKMKNLDMKVLKLLKIGFISSLVLALISSLILVIYNTYYIPDTFYIGISLFRTSLTFAVMFLICAIGFDTIKKTGI